MGMLRQLTQTRGRPAKQGQAKVFMPNVRDGERWLGLQSRLRLPGHSG